MVMSELAKILLRTQQQSAFRTWQSLEMRHRFQKDKRLTTAEKSNILPYK